MARSIEEGLVSGQRMAVDASLIEADANKQFSASKEEWDVRRIDVDAAPRAVKEYLDTLNEAAFGAATTVQPNFTSFSDPASQWTTVPSPAKSTKTPATSRAPSQKHPIQTLREASKEGRDALCASQTHPQAGTASATWTMWRKRRIPSLRHRPKPPQTGQDLSCTAASAKSLNTKALARPSTPHIAGPQHVVFPQNQPFADI